VRGSCGILKQLPASRRSSPAGRPGAPRRWVWPRSQCAAPGGPRRRFLLPGC